MKDFKLLNIKQYIFILFLFFGINVFSQNKISDTTLIFGELRDDPIEEFIFATTSLDSKGYKNDYIKFPVKTKLVVIGAKRIQSQTGSVTECYEIADKGKPFLVYREDLIIPKKYSFGDILAKSERPIDSFRIFSLKESELLYKYQKIRALKFLEKTKIFGIAILNWTFYDESEYTEGTSTSFEIYNSGNKTIKYIWFNVVGYNAVGDKVYDRSKNLYTIPLQAIGPLEKGDTTQYKFEYTWHSDLVESAKIVSMKLQFMDGSFKLINNPTLVTLSEKEYELLN